MINIDGNTCSTLSYDLFIDNQFLADGIDKIMASLRDRLPDCHLILFTADRYYEVIALPHQTRHTRFIMLVSNNDLRFLNDVPLHRISLKTRPEQLAALLQQAATARIKAETGDAGMAFTPRELNVLQMTTEGRNVNDMVSVMGLHVKTIYQTRSAVMHKLGCKTTRDLFAMCKDNLFLHWAQHSHALPAPKY